MTITTFRFSRSRIALASLLLILGSLFAACDINPTATPAAVPPPPAATLPPGASDVAPGAVGTTGAAGAPIAVSLAEWSISPAAISVSAGHQVFNVTNTGKFPHNFAVTVADKTIATKNLAAGESASLETDLAAGTYPTLCSVPGHKDKGMAGTLVVK